MAETVRKVLSYVAGLGTAFIVILVLEAVLHFIFTMPSSADVNDPAAIDRAMRAMPAAAFVALLLAYIIGSLAGGLTAALVSDGSSLSLIHI